jgi:hypothetical protein
MVKAFSYSYFLPFLGEAVAPNAAEAKVCTARVGNILHDAASAECVSRCYLIWQGFTDYNHRADSIPGMRPPGWGASNSKRQKHLRNIAA